jgi:hypothetical protein
MFGTIIAGCGCGVWWLVACTLRVMYHGYAMQVSELESRVEFRGCISR